MLNIANPHSPIEEIKLELLSKANLRLFIKREDLSHPFISGNKWRKLKYHLIDAAEKQKSEIVTFGGAYSNHVLATAAAGAKYGFKTKAFIRGEDVANPILNLAKMFGMQLAFVSREHYKNKEIWGPANLLPPQYLIAEGGAGPLGEQGVQELVEKWEYDHIFCSVGTGSTFKGLVQGMMQQQNHGIVNGIVVLKGAEAMSQEFSCLPPHRYKLHFNYHEGGYAKTNPELMAFIQWFASHTGILLDQVYEAKMIKALINLIDKGYFKEGQKILALHNGGLSGLLSQL
jgi:1-aminocyclopropane-1-carboxylate deaminase